MKRTMINKFSNYFNQLFQTVLEVIEDRPTFLFSKKVYCVLITVNIFQLSGYIFCNGYPKPYYDAEFITIARVNEVAPVTFLLLMKGYDHLTIAFFFIIQFIIYSYYTYIFVLNYVKNHNQKFYLIHNKIFKNINQVLITFFTLYYWIFLTPFTEISLGILSCNDFAFLIEFRNQGNCDQKPLFLKIFATIGVVLSVITNLMILFFFRNYEFSENNLLKRKFAVLQIPICLAFFGLQFFYYITQIEPSIKYICAQVMGFSMAFDIVLNYPFRDKVISVFYAICTTYFWVSHSLIAYWDNTPDYDGNQLFNTLWIFITISSFIFIAIQQYQYEELLRFNISDFEKYYQRVDFYLEEMLKFSRESLKNEEYKFKILEMIVYHKDLCKDVYCPCTVRQYKTTANQISQVYIEDLINSIFKESLKKQIISKNRTEREHLFLKYITFLAKFKNNPTLAYYQLKIYIFRYKNNSSSYFQVISLVLSNSLEYLMRTNQDSLQIGETNLSKPKSIISLSTVVKADIIKDAAIPKISQFINERINFWNETKKGFTNMDDFAEIALKFSAKCKILKEELKTLIMNQDFHDMITTNAHAKIVKIFSLYKCFVIGEVIKAHELQVSVSELKKRDYQKQYQLINTVNIINGSVQTYTASITKDRGKIVNKMSHLHSLIFNYSSQDLQTINNITKLMPYHISQIHDTLIDNYIDRGFSYQLIDGIQSFGLDKNGYIFPVGINLSSLFGIQDDFCMNATILKYNTEKQYILLNSTGQNLGLSQKLLKQLFYLSHEQFLSNEGELVEIKKDFEKVNLFFYIPALIKVIKKNQLSKRKQEDKDNLSSESNPLAKNGNEINKDLSKCNKSSLIEKSLKLQIKIPYNIVDLNQKFFNGMDGDKSNCLSGILKNKKALENNQIISREVLREQLKQFEDFYKKNESEWDASNCVSCLEASANIYEEKIYYYSKIPNSCEKQIQVMQQYKIEITEIKDKMDDIEEIEQTFETESGVQDDIGMSIRTIHTCMESVKKFKRATLNAKNKANEDNNKEIIQDNSPSNNLITPPKAKETISQFIIDNNPMQTSQEQFESSPKCNNDYNDATIQTQALTPLHKFQFETPQIDQNPIFGNTMLFPSLLLSPREAGLNESSNQLHGREQRITLNCENEYQPETTERNPEQQLLNLSSSTINPNDNNDVAQAQQTSLNNNQSHILQNISKFFKSNEKNKRKGSIFKNNNPTQNIRNKNESQHSLFKQFNDTTFMPTRQTQDINLNTSIAYEVNRKQSGSSITLKLQKLMQKKYSILEDRKTTAILLWKSQRQITQVGSSNKDNASKNNNKNNNFNNNNNNNLNNSMLTTNLLHSVQLERQDLISKKSVKTVKTAKTIVNGKSVKRNMTKKFNLKEEIKLKNEINNNQPQSVSSINQSMRSYDNSIMQVIANQRTIKSSQAISFLLILLISSFCLVSTVFIYILSNFQNTIKEQLHNIQGFSQLNVEYTNQTMSQLFLFEQDHDIFNLASSGIMYYSIDQICSQSNLLYSNLFLEYNQFIKDFNSSPNQFNITVFSDQQNFILLFILIHQIYFQFQIQIKILTQKQFVQYYFQQKIYNRLPRIHSAYLVDLFFYNIYSIKKACILKNQNQQNYDGLYYLLDNLQLNDVQTKQIVSAQLEKTTQDKTIINDFFYVFTISVICLFSITTFLSIPILQKINLYKERILLLISRINVDECETELSKLKLCLNVVNSTTEEWINEDFIAILAENEKKSDKNQTGKDDGDKLNNISGQNKSSTQQNQKKQNQQQFSSMILNQKLSVGKKILIVFLLNLSSSIFFGTVYAVNRSKAQSLTPILSLYKDSLYALQSLSSVISFTEILGHRQQLKSSLSPNLSLFDSIQNITQAYDQNINQLLTFANELSNQISDEGLFTSSQINSFKDLFTRNLCYQFPNDIVCTKMDKDHPALGSVGTGFLNVLTAYKNIYISYQTLFSKDVDPPTEQYQVFSQSNEFQYLILYGFQMPIHAMMSLTNLIYNVLIDIIDSLFNFMVLYFIIGGTIMGIAWIIICTKIRSNINQDLQGISFALTCIPFEKLNEEPTIYMLKAIKKM